MFCQHCGNEIRQGLTYCNRCGARSATDLERSYSLANRDKIARNLSFATGISGFAGIVGLGYIVNNMIWRGEISPPAFLLVLMLGAVILGIVITLGVITSIAYRKSLNLTPPRFQESEPRSQFQASPAVAELEEKPSPFFSVTENTTRSFEPALVPKQEN